MSESITKDDHIAAIEAIRAEYLGRYLGAEIEIKRLRAALQDAVDNCCECSGTGNAYTMEDETKIGQPPGSSRIDCPLCSKQRAALADQQTAPRSEE